MGIEWIIIAIIAVLAILAGYVAFGQDNLAKALRALFIGAKAKMTDELDDAVNRIKAAQADTEKLIAKANDAALLLKQQRNAVERKVAVINSQADSYQRAAEKAARENRGEALVKAALTGKSEVLQKGENDIKALELLIQKEKAALEVHARLLQRRAELATAEVTIRARAKLADTIITANELLADINLEGVQSDYARALELVEQREDKAAAAVELANIKIGKTALDAELEELMSEETTKSIDEAATELLARYGNAVNHLETPSKEASAPDPKEVMDLLTALNEQASGDTQK